MIRILFFSLIFIARLTVSAQNFSIQPDDPAFIAKYENFDFKGKFAATILKNDVHNYFLLDFSKLASRFDRVYFLNLSFSAREIINIDPVITKEKICFMSDQKYKEEEVLNIFDELKNKVAVVSASWSDNQKSTWLKENDKYK